MASLFRVLVLGGASAAVGVGAGVGVGVGTGARRAAATAATAAAAVAAAAASAACVPSSPTVRFFSSSPPPPPPPRRRPVFPARKPPKRPKPPPYPPRIDPEPVRVRSVMYEPVVVVHPAAAQPPPRPLKKPKSRAVKVPPPGGFRIPTEAERKEIHRLRAEDPATNTIGALVRRFRVHPRTVTSVVKCPEWRAEEIRRWDRMTVGQRRRFLAAPRVSAIRGWRTKVVMEERIAKRVRRTKNIQEQERIAELLKEWDRYTFVYKYPRRFAPPGLYDNVSAATLAAQGGEVAQTQGRADAKAKATT